MPALFYQKYWHAVAGDVTRGVLDFLNEGDSTAEPKCFRAELCDHG